MVVYARKMTSRPALVIAGALALMLLTLPLLMQPVLAQQSQTVPEQIQPALDDLSTQLGEDVTFESLASFRWAYRDYPDASLGCPQPGQVYAQVVTPGYQFDLTYAGTTYDYRVSEDGQTVILCDSGPAEPIEDTPDGTYDPQPCGQTYTVVSGDTLAAIANQCDTTIDALLESNSQISEPALILPGQVLSIPQSIDGIELLPTPTPFNGRNVSIWPRVGDAGTEITLMASDFPPNTEVDIGLGLFASEYEVIEEATTDDEGSLEMMLTVPDYVEPGDRWVYLVVLDDEKHGAGPFHVRGIEDGDNGITMTPLPPATPTPQQATFDRTNIYLIAVGDAGETGQEIGCGDSLIPVEVTFEPTIAPLTAALEELFAIDTRMYGQSGLYNPLYRSDLSVVDIDITNGVAEIDLTGQMQLGGACDNPRVEAMLTEIALQYDTIDSVVVRVDGVPLEELLSGA